MPIVFVLVFICLFFFFNATATTEIYTLSLHDALPIYVPSTIAPRFAPVRIPDEESQPEGLRQRHVALSTHKVRGVGDESSCIGEKAVP